MQARGRMPADRLTKPNTMLLSLKGQMIPHQPLEKDRESQIETRDLSEATRCSPQETLELTQ